MLQWGRGLSATETLVDRCVQDRAAEASMGPRPFGHGNVPFEVGVGRLVQLQWGRGLSATETERVQYDITLVCKASMGPRPFGHGNVPSEREKS